ncbi:MAG: hypothetical protein IJX10_05085 [Phascolarctobacterium sp.]|nr:hypothetical protein [Phascolarctobacterium sp.]
MQSISTQAIYSAITGKKVFCKFLSANDTGETGGHQSGIYISKPAIPILFNEAGQKGENKDKWVKIKWQNDFITDTRFIYYGKGTRNEYRITNFGKGFPLLRPCYTGALFVLVKDTDEDYQGFILETDDEINQFLDAFGISPTETNKLIDNKFSDPVIKEKQEMYNFIANLQEDFPNSFVMAEAARKIQNKVYNHIEYVRTDPDKKLVEWTEMEYKLFRAIEHERYGSMISNGFDSVERFITVANQVLNRRKSRAGKSLEHHLSAIFDGNDIEYTSQAITEGNKKPDFIFPSQEAYHDFNFPLEKLVTLAAKTTCKDRWRQVLNEADRLKGETKYLCTLQQGISTAQMDEMQAEKVILVVPKIFIPTYPKDRQDKIWTLGKFVEFVKEIGKK